MKESRPAVAAEHPGAAPAEVMKLLGAAWRGLPEAGRAGFVERARALKAEEGAGPEWWSRGDGDTDGGGVMVVVRSLAYFEGSKFSVWVAWRDLAW